MHCQRIVECVYVLFVVGGSNPHIYEISSNLSEMQPHPGSKLLFSCPASFVSYHIYLRGRMPNSDGEKKKKKQDPCNVTLIMCLLHAWESMHMLGHILNSLFSTGTQQGQLSFSTVIPTIWVYFCWSYAKFLQSSIGCAIEIHTSLLFRHLMSTVGVIYCPETIPSLTNWMDALSFSLQLQKS